MFSTRLMAAAAAMFVAASAANASTLYYGGDPYVDPFGDYWFALTDSNMGLKDYDRFVVPTGHTWSVTSLFQQMAFLGPVHTVSTASWEIRTGVSSSSLGTLIASGSVSPTNTPSSFTNNPSLYADLITLTLPSPVTLTSGAYWLSIQPQRPDGDYHTYVQGTAPHANAIGTGQDDSFIVYYMGHYNQTAEGNDLSQGLSGTDMPVPEPATALLFASGLLGGGLWCRRLGRRG